MHFAGERRSVIGKGFSMNRGSEEVVKRIVQYSNSYSGTVDGCSLFIFSTFHIISAI